MLQLEPRASLKLILCRSYLEDEAREYLKIQCVPRFFGILRFLAPLHLRWGQNVLKLFDWHNTILLNPKKGVNKIGLDVRVFSVSAIVKAR